jgi:thiol-disulfide isomerase/thioredoxin
MSRLSAITIAITTIVAVLLAPGSRAGEADDHHRLAVEQIRKLGGRVAVKKLENGETYTAVNLLGPRYGRAWRGGDAGARYLKDLADLRQLRIQGVDAFSDRGMEHLQGLDGLRLLRLRNTQVTDEGLVHLERLTRLEFLGLSSKKFTDRALDHLRALQNLESLRLDEARITDEGLGKLEQAGLLSRLEFLSLSGAQVTDAGLKRLRGATRLKRLFLDRTRTTEAGMAHLGGLPQLEALTLGGTGLSDAGLEQLKGLRNLELLHLDSTRITDKAVPQLKAWSGLTRLSLSGSKITYAGFLELRRALPKCKIVWARPTPLKVGDAPPELSVERWLQAPEGAAASWKLLRGKVVVLEFWATWCPHCLRAIPHVNGLAEKFQGRPVRFLAVTAEKQPAVEKFLEKRPVRAWIGLDPDRSMLTSYGVRGVPYVIVVDRAGTIRALTSPAGLTEQTLEGLLAPEKEE